MRGGARNRQKGRKGGSVLIERGLGINAFRDSYGAQTTANSMVDRGDYNAVFKPRIEALWVKRQTEEVSRLDFDGANDFGRKGGSETESWE